MHSKIDIMLEQAEAAFAKHAAVVRFRKAVHAMKSAWKNRALTFESFRNSSKKETQLKKQVRPLMTTVASFFKPRCRQDPNSSSKNVNPNVSDTSETAPLVVAAVSELKAVPVKNCHKIQKINQKKENACQRNPLALNLMGSYVKSKLSSILLSARKAWCTNKFDENQEQSTSWRRFKRFSNAG